MSEQEQTTGGAGEATPRHAIMCGGSRERSILPMTTYLELRTTFRYLLADAGVNLLRDDALLSETIAADVRRYNTRVPQQTGSAGVHPLAVGVRSAQINADRLLWEQLRRIRSGVLSGRTCSSLPRHTFLCQLVPTTSDQRENIWFAKDRMPVVFLTHCPDSPVDRWSDSGAALRVTRSTGDRAARTGSVDDILIPAAPLDGGTRRRMLTTLVLSVVPVGPRAG
jgi:hypothetical protein